MMEVASSMLACVPVTSTSFSSPLSMNCTRVLLRICTSWMREPRRPISLPESSAGTRKRREPAPTCPPIGARASPMAPTRTRSQAALGHKPRPQAVAAMISAGASASATRCAPS
eukprot:CAMPEP_0175760716 /NCGR_PEP_ID=MMETSP0097-20121207/66263_1 /TAXON_ID=311494 /ORGANISM="Alexandrium monilatum, Strain CCMP3105" /LENGTH=113 /DNA_ID=CAMNT_0017070219 /DNA_START=30 /DNA_END=368 /DNA_ORIENTATION=-